MEDAIEQSTSLAVMFLDLDRFKEVNDALGHAIGDRLLNIVVQRLSGCLRTMDVIARWGGDEFILLQPQISGRNDAGEIAHRLIDVLQSDTCIQGNAINVTVSVGIALYPEDGSDACTLVQCADIALYRAKNSGRNNYQYYSTDVMVSEL
ncbi:diguanylate cyclase (GGDEF) [Acaryochloris marina MBIC11017]|uniref:Diguanylate cyclase (GGDEF) n=1 Tax=Acaryochloris marina (strain MBIC 11017) TaxID=329726 RepID=B0C7L9_ACAM1|nr:diguanylate cyclase (GGDEF) [Acaryochloris marina MBIC11017]